ncbi:MAG: elongator complex protein 3 [Cetobacterium sp.]|uniref:elongator complex protein 3 n=1 Tax=Cetobacterium sp. TaxID=2071632 RepID=UPI003F37A1FB
MKHYNIPVFISHFGCPNDCVFCNQKKINGRETDVTLEDLKEIIDSYLKTLPKKSKKEVAFFGGTFTGISLKLQEDYLRIVKPYIDRGEIQGIRLSTRPDYINEEIMALLKKYGVTTIELGVQSLDPLVLKRTARYYPENVVYEACELIKKSNINLGIQVMIGLPEATLEKDIETAKKVIELQPDIARIYPTLVIKETELAKMYLEKKYNPLTLDEAIERTKKIYSLFLMNGINVIRVGLQPSDDLREEGNVLGGPFHPAFRELVEGEIYYDFLKNILLKDEILDIQVNEKDMSRVIGINKVNRERFGKKFIIKIDKELSFGNIRVNGIEYSRLDVLRGEL